MENPITIKPLKTSEIWLSRLCICPIDESVSKWKNSYCILFSSSVMLVLFTFISASVVFALQFFSIDLEKTLYACYQIFGWAPELYIFIIAFSLRREISNIFRELSLIYMNDVDAESFKFLMRANERSEWLWKMYVKYAMVYNVLGVAIGGSTCSIIYCFFKRRTFDRNHLFLQFVVVLPWNQQIIPGYIGETIFSMLACEAYLIINGAILLLFIALVFHLQAFSKIIQRLFKKLDDNDGTSDELKLSTLIRFHNTVKKWFSNTVKVYKRFVMCLLMSNMVSLACVIFQMDLRSNELGMEFAFLFVALTVKILNLFVYCYFGKLATDCSDKMCKYVYESNWQRLPANLQMYFVVMIANTQRSFYYHGFGVFVLNLETFTKQIKAVLTYYMMFKALTEK